MSFAASTQWPQNVPSTQNTNLPSQQSAIGGLGTPGQSLLQPTKTSHTESLFGASAQPQQSSNLFGGLGGASQPQSQQQAPSLFAGSGAAPFPNPTAVGGLSNHEPQTKHQIPQTNLGQNIVQQSHSLSLSLGQSHHKGQESQDLPSLWEEGRGLGVYRTIPAQVTMIKDKWDPSNFACPFRTYLYQVVDEQNAPFYQPGPGEDERKWEEAVAKRPGPRYVPTLARGFWDLGKRAQRQREYIEKMNIRLHDINSSLEAQTQIHTQHVASRLNECRRRHALTSQRALVLATKLQVLRNRGYVLDTAEEELKSKLSELEKDVIDPALYGREQEVWARMLSIQERGKRLQSEMDKIQFTLPEDSSNLNEATVKAAKKALDAYDMQLRHLHNEYVMIESGYDEWERDLYAEVAHP